MNLVRSFPSVLEWHGLYEIQSVAFRLLVDLQFASIRRALKRPPPPGAEILDVGAGRSPYRELFETAKSYTTVDNLVPADFDSLESIPAGRKFDLTLLLEVLEHVENPEAFLKGLRERCRGELWLSVPFAARVHDAPGDFHRWTPAGLKAVLERSGWRVEKLEPRGNAFTTLCAKYFFLLFQYRRHPLSLLLLLGTVPVLLPLAHFSLRFPGGDDPLGYFVIARPA